MSTQNLTYRILALLLLSPAVSGCTVVGLGVGAALDAGKGKPLVPQALNTGEVKPGKRITLTLRDDSKVSGTFRGVVAVPPEAYAVSYDRARADLGNDATLPCLGEEVVIVMDSGDTVTGRLLGFDNERVVLESATGPSDVRVGTVSRVADGYGHTVTGRALMAYLWSGLLPVRSAVALDVRRGHQELIPLDRILEIKQPANGKKIGTMVGGALDVIGFAAYVICLSSDCLDFGFGY